MSTSLLPLFVRTLARPIGKSERHRARLLLLDWLACIAGARGSEAHEMGVAVSTRGWERATYTGNALELGDWHSDASLSAGAVIWPAAMSMPSADMDARLDAAVRGYEAMIAIGMAMDSHHRAHWDPTATMGVFGACAAFGSLIGFAPIEYANAMGNAGSVAGGLMHMQHDPDVLTRQWHVYHAVRTGRDAALQCHYGATGPQGVLEGPQGLFAAMTKEHAALGSADEGWLIEQVQLRLPGRAVHDDAALDAAIARRDGEDFSMREQAAMLKDVIDMHQGETPSTSAGLQQQLIAKMHALARWGGLSTDHAQRAIHIALDGSDGSALDTLLEEWTK